VLLCFGGIELVYLAYLLLGVDSTPVLLIRDVGWLLLAALAGAARVYFFHLSFHREYAQWLALTPWTPAKQLPLGPVHLVVQDLVLVTLALLTRHDAQIAWVYFPLSFLLGYLAVSAWVMRLAESPWGMVTLFGIGLVVRLMPWPETALAAAALVYEASILGLDAWLGQFPRPFWPYEVRRDVGAHAALPGWPGWPIGHLSSQDESDDAIGTWRWTGEAILLGWYAYCGLALRFGHEPPTPQSVGLCWLFLIPLALSQAAMRYFRATQRFAPPIDLWGRIWTLRWIIPGYDVILVTPLAILVMPPLLLTLLVRLECPVSIAGGLAAALLAFLTVAGPPSWKSFRLTGDHRILPDHLKVHGYTEI
jgi:hypothetical protein